MNLSAVLTRHRRERSFVDILQKIARHTRARVEQRKQSVSLDAIRAQAERLPIETNFPFERVLSKEGIAFICEVKRASPTKGLIAESFPYAQIAREYEAAGADAVSVLTEPEFFLGDDRYLSEIAQAVTLPLLRKDFTVDGYMIYEAKLLGASAVLLICGLLDADSLSAHIRTAHGLGLSALVEAHTEPEVEMALAAGARIIGVNNRDLRTFEVDLATSEALRRLVPKDRLFVSESGIRTPEDVQRLREMGVDAALVGETFMRAADKASALQYLRGDSGV